MRKEDFAMALLEALKAAEGPRGGQSMNRKEPEAVFFDEILKKAGNQEEFSQRIREGKTFKLEEKAGIHIISLDTDKPPIIQITGEFGALSRMLSFAMSEMIERAAEDTGDREGIENHFRQITEAAIMASRL